MLRSCDITDLGCRFNIWFNRPKLKNLNIRNVQNISNFTSFLNVTVEELLMCQSKIPSSIGSAAFYFSAFQLSLFLENVCIGTKMIFMGHKLIVS